MAACCSKVDYLYTNRSTHCVFIDFVLTYQVTFACQKIINQIYKQPCVYRNTEHNLTIVIFCRKVSLTFIGLKSVLFIILYNDITQNMVNLKYLSVTNNCCLWYINKLINEHRLWDCSITVVKIDYPYAPKQGFLQQQKILTHDEAI